MPSSNQQQQQHLLLLLAVPLGCAVCAAVLGYRAGAIAWRLKRKQHQDKEEREKYLRAPSAGMQHHRPLRELIGNSTGRGFGVVKRVYVVPGGGPGSAEHAGYPPWTAQRVTKALQRYDAKYQDTTAFLALGAGSMNAPSARGEDGHVVFESARITEDLVRGGVPPGSIIADFASWDTVGNAWFARMAVEAILDMSFRHGDRAGQRHAAPPPTAFTPAPAAAATTGAAPSLSSPRKPPFSGGTISEGGDSDGEDSSGGGIKKDDDDDFDERKSFLKVRGQGTVAAAGRGGKAAATTQKELKRADAVAAAAAAAEAARTGAGSGGGGVGGEGEEKLPAARAGEAYGGGEMRKWMFDWKAKKARARKGPLNVTVFVSDFHADRIDAVFQWVFGLEPSLLKGKTTVTTVSIDTPVEMWAGGPEQRQARQAHERKGADQARQRAKEIKTVEEFRAFMILGGHKGYFDLTHGRYQASPGGGWGGSSSSAA